MAQLAVLKIAGPQRAPPAAASGGRDGRYLGAGGVMMAVAGSY
jgi:hypothetical protein